MNFVDKLFIAYFVCLVFMIIMFYRDAMIMRHRQRKLRECAEQARILICQGDLDWNKAYRELDNADYIKQLWNFKKWKYEQFFPKGEMK